MPRFFVGKEAGLFVSQAYLKCSRSFSSSAVEMISTLPCFTSVGFRISSSGIAYSPVAIELVEIEEPSLAAHGREDFRAFDFYVARRQ